MRTAPTGMRWATGGGSQIGGCNGYHLARIGIMGTLCGRFGPHNAPDPSLGTRICGACARLAKVPVIEPSEPTEAQVRAAAKAMLRVRFPNARWESTLLKRCDKMMREARETIAAYLAATSEPVEQARLSEREALEFTRHEIETLLATGNISYRRVDIRIVDEPSAASEGER